MPPPTDREALKSRQLPEMKLSDGLASDTLTPPTRPLSTTNNASERFAIRGNAVITGGLGNLALEGARALLEHGLHGLVLLDRDPNQNPEPFQRLLNDFPDREIRTESCDVTNEDDVRNCFEAKITHTIDMLVCFAGVVSCDHAVDLDAREWRRTIDVNTTGAFLCAQAAARRMLAQNASGKGSGGSIVLISSISAHRVNYPQPQVGYNVAKAAVLSMAKSLAAEWAVHGIRVNSLSPGYMDTILNEGEGLEKAKKSWARRNPMGRMGQPCELTGPLVLLCSKFGGAYINGADLVVDGGGIVF
ncbi:MAG: hypothetical protein M1831_003706 [Alyxoria varia]|nr:MAG: hypothetical protein M1831_003706 [Alyxoria varia]